VLEVQLNPPIVFFFSWILPIFILHITRTMVVELAWWWPLSVCWPWTLPMIFKSECLVVPLSNQLLHNSWSAINAFRRVESSFKQMSWITTSTNQYL
jgi:hypothetical protein